MSPPRGARAGFGHRGGRRAPGPGSRLQKNLACIYFNSKTRGRLKKKNWGAVLVPFDRSFLGEHPTEFGVLSLLILSGVFCCCCCFLFGFVFLNSPFLGL